MSRLRFVALAGLVLPGALTGQEMTGREIVESLDVPSLEFEQPEVDHHTIREVPVMVLESNELPLVTVYAYFKGGYGLFGRERYAAAMGLPTLLRYGGTTDLPPEEVDAPDLVQGLGVHLQCIHRGCVRLTRGGRGRQRQVGVAIAQVWKRHQRSRH